MNAHRRMLVKILVLVPLAVIATLFAIGGAQLVALTNTSRVGVRALFAYWASLPAGLSILLLRKQYTKPRLFLTFALVFLVMQNVGGSIRYYIGSLQPYTDLPLTNITGMLFGLVLFSLLLFHSLRKKKLARDQSKEMSSSSDVILGLIFPITIYAVVWFFVIPFLLIEVLISLSFVFFVTTVALLILCIHEAPQHQFSGLRIDPGFFISACILFVLSAGLLITEIHFQSFTWIYSENIRIASYFLVGLSIQLPYLRKCGFNRATSYSLVILLAALTYLPFTTTIAIEAAALQGTEYPLVPASVVIHLGAGFLSAMMAILLYTRSRRSQSRRVQPLILLYLMWAAVAIVTVIVVVSRTSLGAPIIPAVSASLLTIPLLILIARWSRRDRGKKHPYHIGTLLVVGILLILTVVLGEVINQTLLLSRPEFIGTTYGETILLGANLVIMLCYSAAFFAFAESASGRLNVDMYALGFISTWIVPNILKSYYATWTMGWWVSEILIFIGQLLGPALLGLLYIKTLNEAEESHSRAELYADLLMHDVSNYHQMLLTAIELLCDDDSSSTQKTRLVVDARNVISLAEQLVTNVRLISQSDEISQKNLKPVNLVSLLVESLDDVMEGLGSEAAEIQYRPDVRDAIVLGNELLKHVMLNILYYALQQAAGKPVIKVDIVGRSEAGESFWQTRFRVPNLLAEQVPTTTILKPESDEYEGGLLGLLTARIITEALDGRMTIQEVNEKGEPRETQFDITLPALEQ